MQCENLKIYINITGSWEKEKVGLLCVAFQFKFGEILARNSARIDGSEHICGIP